MREIAQRAGLSAGAVYRYFPGKEALFKAVVESERPEEDASIVGYLEGASPIERLEGLVDSSSSGRRGSRSSDPALDPHSVAALLTTQSVSLAFIWVFAGEYDVAATREVLRRMLAGFR